MRIIALLVSLLVSVAAFSNVRMPMEADVTKFSSKYWIPSRALPTDPVEAIFVIKRDRAVVQKFYDHVLDLSNPKSKNFSKWMNLDEINSMIAPPDAHVKMVTDYVASFGVPASDVRVSKLNDKVFVKMPVAVAGNMLDTTFARFRSVDNTDIVLTRVTKPYSLPSDIASVVALVDDIVRLPTVRRSIITDVATNVSTTADPQFSSCGTTAATCNGDTTPAVLQSAYNFGTVSTVASGNRGAVAEFQYQYYDDADLQAFSKACKVTATISQAIGGNNPNICNVGCVEALLDIEYMGAIINPIPLDTIYSSSYSLLDWVNGVMSQAAPQWVQSVSYGNDEVQQTGSDYMEQVNTQFAAAAAMGISILFASGDQGVWGRSGVGKTFNPDFPGGSPWVTAVGGTNFATKSVIGAETTWNCGGGGFSDEFAAPSWQTAQVANYFSLASAAGVLPAASLYNAAGRGYPDVSALGGQTNPYCVAKGGGSTFTGVAGTSASCPVVAGIVTQLNNERILAGKTSLGFLNQFFYSNPQCFNDVNDGSQNNCNAGTTGFAALNGWDPATGLGTPNYGCLVTAALALP